MSAIRSLLAQRHVAAWLCAAALLLRLLVPTGYMVASEHGHVAITICTGMADASVTSAMPGMHHGTPDHGRAGDHGKAAMPCAFSGLGMAGLGAIDPILLVALLAFIRGVGLRPALPSLPSRPAYLRPPLRGPPARL